MWLIAGLGNVGPRYELTRHNVGFLVADFLAHTTSFKKNFNSEVAQLSLANNSCLILKPLTFMNKSGGALSQAMAFYKIPLENLIVIHDELDLPLGELRIKRGGSDGGHNGLKDISRLLGSDYIRIRLGISRPAHKGHEADYVLSNFKTSELMLVQELFAKIQAAIESIISEGLEKAQAHHQIKAQKKA
jgi:PTH1 family peptidyl-tRNA hydrolase